eukprot:CAMPEP_0185754408 /NCGR_PEP_ID=MMETSP1174-20130828/13058_1 /TAXON_ID=35687 /ORGANISM="Dictyocha speculum, Strain CCMP1381" /LENGTH=374 /DNA_ID=CAMNT_0028432599 /DNA_START=84 /DNA_END=1208 /DNA_ORIENTATION=+
MIMHPGRVTSPLIILLLALHSCSGFGLQLRACIPSLLGDASKPGTSVHRQACIPPPLGDISKPGTSVHRRSLLGSGLRIGAGIVTFRTATLPAPASAFDLKPPENSKLESELLLENWDNPPISAGRPRIEQDFAVLLMRSSYNTVDALDFIGMDTFQREFFLFRQSKYEKYIEALSNAFIVQGELADPRYFDFISYAQYATISSCMNRGLFVFTEQVGADGEEQVVRRDTTITNALLPAMHSKAVGDTILNWLLERYNKEGEQPRLPIAMGQSTDALVANINQLLGLFFLNNFLSDWTVRLVGGGQQGRQAVELVVSNPATRWSQQALSRRGSVIHNDFEVKTVIAYLNACGVVARQISTRFKGTDVIHKIEYG